MLTLVCNTICKDLNDRPIQLGELISNYHGSYQGDIPEEFGRRQIKHWTPSPPHHSPCAADRYSRPSPSKMDGRPMVTTSLQLFFEYVAWVVVFQAVSDQAASLQSWYLATNFNTNGERVEHRAFSPSWTGKCNQDVLIPGSFSALEIPKSTPLPTLLCDLPYLLPTARILVLPAVILAEFPFLLLFPDFGILVVSCC